MIQMKASGNQVFLSFGAFYPLYGKERLSIENQPFDTLLILVTKKREKLNFPKHPKLPNIVDFLCEKVSHSYGKGV